MEFNLPTFWIINGRCGQGKSHLIRFIMRSQRKKFDYGLVFCQTSFGVDSFDYVPKKYVHPMYNETILQKFMDIQASLVKQGTKKNAYLVFDDCLDAQTFRSKVFNRLITTFRHYNISIIISSQYPNAIPPKFRTNAFKSVVFRMTTNAALRALWESYAQDLEFQEFKKQVLALKPYHFIIFNVIKGTRQTAVAPENIPKFEMKLNLIK